MRSWQTRFGLFSKVTLSFKEFVMSVFVLLGRIDYEGCMLLGVFSSRERAEAAFEDRLAGGYDGLEVVERVVDAGVEPYFD